MLKETRSRKGEHADDSVTVLIPTWKRHANVRKIIPALREQSVCPQIVLVNMGEPYEGPAPDDLWQIPFNTGPYSKFNVACAYDGWLAFMDDDILPTHEDLLGRMLETALRTGAYIVGPRARDVRRQPPHYKGRGDTKGWTNNIKMALSMMHRSVLSLVRYPPAGWLLRCDDLWISLEVSQGKKVLFADPELLPYFKDMNGLGVSLSRQPEHYDEREECCAAWAAMERVGIARRG